LHSVVSVYFLNGHRYYQWRRSSAETLTLIVNLYQAALTERKFR
jgi:hypothetical protein